MGRIAEFFSQKNAFDSDRKLDVRLVLPLLVLVFIGCLASLYLLREISYQYKYPDYYQERMGELEALLAQHPGNAKTAVEMAMVMYLDGQEAKAIKLAQQVYQDRPDDPQVMLYLGLMLSDHGEAAEAVPVLSKLSAKAPGYQRAKTQFYLGKSLYEQALYPQAIQKLQACVQYDPGMSIAYIYLARSRVQSGDKSGAIAAYRKVLQIDSRQEEAAKAVLELQGK